MREFISPALPLIALDYDGTLAPIMPSPSEARATAEIERAITRLRDFTSVIILTGRSAAEIRQILRCEVDLIVGNHGLESNILSRQDRESMNNTVKGWLLQLGVERGATDALDTVYHKFVGQFPELSGVQIEEKDLSLSIHYRHAMEPTRAKIFLKDAVSMLRPLPHIVGGKKVLNLLPSTNTDKGTALLSLLNALGYTRAIFIGDDETDEIVFRKQSQSILGIKVGGPEGTKAQLYVQDQTAVSKLLSYIQAQISRSQK